MSGVVKKIAKSIKKVFKKVVKVIKKILKSKLFKIVVAAAAIYFTAGTLLAAGGLGGATAAAAAPISTSVAAGAGVSSAAGATAAASGASALGASSSLVAGASTAATTTTGGILSSLTSGKALLASTALNMGNSYMQGKAAEKEQKDAEKEMYKNNTTNIDVYGRTMDALNESGWRNADTGAIGRQGVDQEQAQQNTQASRQETSNKESTSAMAGISSNVQESYAAPAPKSVAPKTAPKFYNNANNKWQKVKAA